MPKLLVLDFTAIVNPIDRHLYPGVIGRISDLRSAGWTMAIVSDQSDCDWQNVPAKDLTVGAHFRLYKEDGMRSSQSHSVKAFQHRSIFTEIRTTSGGWFCLGLNDEVLTRSKTIKNAIDEMRHTADLCGIADLILCPFVDGHNAIESAKINGLWRFDLAESQESNGQSVQYGNFLKPGPGMLNRMRMVSIGAFDRAVFVGIKPGDRAAADAADFEFIDADDWRCDRVTV